MSDSVGRNRYFISAQQPTGHLTITCDRGRGCKGFFARFLVQFCDNFYFKLRYCGFTKPSGLRYLEIFEKIRILLMSPSQGRGAFDYCLGGVRYLNWKVSEMEECKGKKKDFLDE